MNLSPVILNQNPEVMGNLRPDKFSTKAKFHLDYLKRMLKERNIKYSKTNPSAVCQKSYLDQLISRYEETNDIQSFGNWYEFIKDTLS